jgi:hypothetical protein
MRSIDDGRFFIDIERRRWFLQTVNPAVRALLPLH